MPRWPKKKRVSKQGKNRKAPERISTLGKGEPKRYTLSEVANLLKKLETVLR